MGDPAAAPSSAPAASSPPAAAASSRPVTSARLAAASSSTLPPTRRVVRLSCTHPVFDKVYGTEYPCGVCGQVPSIGWIYVCRQDSAFVEAQAKSRKQLKQLANKTDPNELELLEFSKSVVNAAANNHYTMKELELLKEKKAEVLSIIKDTTVEKETKSRTETAELAAPASGSKTKPNERKATMSDGNNSLPGSILHCNSRTIQACDWRVCHTCRPFSRFRSFLSFEAVLNDEVPQRSQWDPEHMPISDANVLRNMDWEREISEEYWEREIAREDNENPTSPGTTSNERFSEGFSDSLANSYYQLVEELYNSPENFGFSPESSGTSDRNLWRATMSSVEARLSAEPSGLFNIDLWRTMMTVVQDQASAIRLPGNESDDNLGSEVTDEQVAGAQVDGGVLPTEDTVNMGTQAVIASVL